jgi:RNA polymerase sigma-70 factor (sigma-E family)
VSSRDAEFTEYAQARLSWLRGLAYVLCRDWHRADDLVQTALTRTYVHWRQVRAADNQDGYVRTILVREFVRERGSFWARRVVLTSEPPDSTGRAPRSGGTDLFLAEALALLPPRRRAALVLRFYCDLSVDQTADVLGCSPGTVKSQTAKGLASLRQSLGSGVPYLPEATQPPSSLGGSDHG